VRTAEDLAKEVEALRNEGHKYAMELVEARQELALLKQERTKLMTWIDTLMYQLARH